jgi:hypothetical protein
LEVVVRNPRRCLGSYQGRVKTPKQELQDIDSDLWRLDDAESSYSSDLRMKNRSMPALEHKH